MFLFPSQNEIECMQKGAEINPSTTPEYEASLSTCYHIYTFLRKGERTAFFPSILGLFEGEEKKI